MGKPTGFIDYQRKDPRLIDPKARIKNYKEFLVQLPTKELKRQGARCMDCGVPFCHAGCPLGNLIPEWNDAVYRGDWQKASEFLHQTNNFPEFTGRTCPAPCEESCVLSLNEPAVTIKNIENSIVERAFTKGWIVPKPPAIHSGKKVAVVGSGPAGLACAAQLNSAGHFVTVFEREDRVGGLLRYGIPDFKLEKWVIDRRVEVLQQEGITFRTGVEVGRDVTEQQLRESFDAVVLCLGSTVPRELNLPGHDLDGIHEACDFLIQQNRRVAGDAELFPTDRWCYSTKRQELLATGKRVLIIGGGDTGADCVGVSNRQAAASITQFEYKPVPPGERPEEHPWPYWPMRLRTSSSHEEGCQREWATLTKEFRGQNGVVTELVTVDVEWIGREGGARGQMREIPGSVKHWPADLVLLAIGYQGPELDGIVKQYSPRINKRGLIETDHCFQTSVPGLFACGDARRGQSLVVWAISEGRECAREIDYYLSGTSHLPTKGEGDLPMVSC